MITLCVPTIRRYDLLAQLLVPSAERNTRPPDRYYIIDNGGGLDAAAYGLPTEKTTVFNPGRNLGVAASWNQAHRANEEWVIMACDDMDLYSTTIEALIAAAETHPEIGFFFPQMNAHTMFGVYLQRRWCFEKVGPYDENFWPAYYEDNDYCRRLELAGMSTMEVPNCGMNHVVSATLKTYNEDEMAAHHARFEALGEYYQRKWGGMPHRETYTVPFDGKSP